jgi:hypothetical protein
MVYGMRHTTETPYFLTVTAPGIVERPHDWNRTAPARFAALVRDLRGHGLPGLEYARVLEMQRRGLLHVHGLVVGWRRVDLEMVRLLCVRHGFGPRFEIAAVRNVEATGGYMASQYLAKSHEDLGRRYRVVQFSRGWPRDRMTEAVLDAVSAADPVVAVIPDGMSWWDWAGMQEAATPSAAALSLPAAAEGPPGGYGPADWTPDLWGAGP